MLLASVFLLGACIQDELQPSGGWAAPQLTEEYVYVGSKEGTVARLLASDGEPDESWSFPSDLDVGRIYGAPAVTEDGVYAAGYDCQGTSCEGHVIGLSSADGSALWGEGSFDLRTELVGAPAVYEPNGTLVFGTSSIGDEDEGAEGYLYALDTSGSAAPQDRVKWRFPAGGKVWGGATVSESDGVAYFGGMDGVLHAVRLTGDDTGGGLDQPGRELWSFEADGAIATQPLLRDGKLYFGDFGGTVYSLDVETRRTRGPDSLDASSGEWKFETDGWFWAQPLLHEGVLYVGAISGQLFALNAGDGRQVWAEPAQIEGQILGAPAALDLDSGVALAAPSGDRDVKVLTAGAGESLNGFATDVGVKAPVVERDGVLFVYTTDDELMRFSVRDRRMISCVQAESGDRC